MPRKQPKSADWRNLPLADWNTTTWHAYLADLNAERSGVDYVPFGQGSVGQRWSTEKGQLKQAATKYGNDVLKRYIDICFAKAPHNPQYPCLSFGFMWAYMRNELAQAQAAETRGKKAEKAAEALTDENVLDWL